MPAILSSSFGQSYSLGAMLLYSLMQISGEGRPRQSLVL
jgi:hypothetical protein